MWIPEVCFANTVFLEPIDSIGNIPAARWKLTCYICKQRGVGACIQCNKANCYTAFHVTCAQQAALHMKIDAIRETSTAGTSVTVRKAAYCDMHTPHDADTGEEGEAGGAAKRAAEAKAAWRQKMKKARKILAEKRSAAPMVALPTIPPDRIQELAGLVAGVSRMSQFMHRLLAFWTLKRQSRNGVPLLRRLTNAHSSRRHASSSGGGANTSMGGANTSAGGLNASVTELSPRKDGNDAGPSGDSQKDNEKKDEELETNMKRKDPTCKKKDGGGPKKKRKLLGAIENNIGATSRPPSRPASPFNNMAALISQIKYWQTLRQDLEKARLLCELISKREREKKKMINVCSELRLVQLSPMVSLQLHVLQQLQDRDTNQIFAEPVDMEEVKDYSDVVTHPMDLSTMRQKARDHQYRTIDHLEKDFELMIDNCLAYNSKDTIFYKAAVKFRDQGGSFLSQARRSVTITGFDPDTGLLLPHRPLQPPLLSDAAIVTKVDGYLKTLGDGKLGEETELRRLLDQAYLIGYHITRNARIKSIRKELTRIKNSTVGSNGMTAATLDSTEDEEEDDDEREEQTNKLTSADDADGVDEMEEGSCDEKTPTIAPTSPHPSQARSSSTMKEAESLPQSPPGGSSRRRESLSPMSRAEETRAAITSASMCSQPKSTSSAPLFPSTASLACLSTTTVDTTTAPPDDEDGAAPSDESIWGASRRGVRGRGRGAGRRGKGGTRRGDVKQKRIDCFFTKVSGSVITDSEPNNKNTNDITVLKEQHTSGTSETSTIALLSTTCSANGSTRKASSSDTTATSTTSNNSESAVDLKDAVPDEAAGEVSITTSFTDPRDDGDVMPSAHADTALVSARGRGGVRGAPRKRGRPFKRPQFSTMRKPEISDIAANAELSLESADVPPPDDASPVVASKLPTATPSVDAMTAIAAFAADNDEDSPPPPRYALPSSEGLGLGFLDLGKDVSPPHSGKGVAPPHKDSFKVYRTGGEQAPETDEETQSESTSSLGDSDSDSCSDSDSDGGGLHGGGGADSETSAGGEGAVEQSSSGGQEIQLEPLDLVWAKCRGYPWYPALIINPKMPRTGYFHNRVPIPVPPLEVLELAHSCPLTHQYLVLFFDSKRTWQWLPRSKLEPLGERPALDKAKLVESRKPADRKAVKRAYEQAILHRCRVTGDSEGLTGDSEEEQPPQGGE